jgi:hypothetical protein
MEITTEQLLGIIGAKQVAIETLQAQLQVLSKGYQEQQTKIQALEAPAPAPTKAKK